MVPKSDILLYRKIVAIVVAIDVNDFNEADDIAVGALFTVLWQVECCCFRYCYCGKSKIVF